MLCPLAPALQLVPRQSLPKRETKLTKLLCGRRARVEHRVHSSVREVIEPNPDVILAHTPATTVALKQATGTIPIVFVQAADPVNLGFVPSLATPGGNSCRKTAGRKPHASRMQRQLSPGDMPSSSTTRLNEE